MNYQEDLRRRIRNGRIDSILHEIVSAFLLRERLSDTLITIARITLNPPQTVADVYCTVFPIEKSAETETYLRSIERDCRTYLLTHSRMRVHPSIRFHVVLDNAIERKDPEKK
ncbi:MAG: ribosome-binding factor A [Alphaproteobacteria bacterium]|nr:ribosome-binding factor A [Alphaproteobacteria bacterium]